MTKNDDQRTIAQWLDELGMDIERLADLSALDRRVVKAIVAGRYTTSPKQRQRIAQAIGVPTDDILWGGSVQVDHMYGHGPQFGRSP